MICSTNRQRFVCSAALSKHFVFVRERAGYLVPFFLERESLCAYCKLIAQNGSVGQSVVIPLMFRYIIFCEDCMFEGFI